jgi:hypothetical protein
VRESIGGAFLIKIMVVFIVLYNSLLAIAVNYAMALELRIKLLICSNNMKAVKTFQEHVMGKIV